MQQRNKEYLASKYYHWYTLSNWGYLKDVNMDERRRFADIMREDFDKNYIACLTCPDSIAELVRVVFVNFERVLTEAGEPFPAIDPSTGMAPVPNESLVDAARVWGTVTEAAKPVKQGRGRPRKFSI
jgi:hypothetical protein